MPDKTDLMTLFEVRYNHVMLSLSGFFLKCCKISILFSSSDTLTVKTLCPIHSQHSQIWQVFMLNVTNESVVRLAIKRKRTSTPWFHNKTETQNTRKIPARPHLILVRKLQPVSILCAEKTQKIGEILKCPNISMNLLQIDF